MFARRPILVLSLLGTLALGACVEDPLPLEIEIPLTEEEADLLGLRAFREVLVRALEIYRDTAQAAAEVPALVPTSFNSVDSLTVSCPYGGTLSTKVTITGTVDPDTDTGDLNVVAVETYTDCQVIEGGLPYHLDGAPAITLAFDMLLDGSGAIDLDGSMTGGLRAVVGYHASTCEMSLNFSGTLASDGSSFVKYKGTVCGTEISEKTITPSIPEP